MVKKKIILIGVALALVLSVVGGGLAYAVAIEHDPPMGHKLIGFGEMGYESIYFSAEDWDQQRWWDTQFIVTNPNDNLYLTIDYLALIDEDEYVYYEGTPEDWSWEFGMYIPHELSPHEVWQFSIAELIGAIYWDDPWFVMDDYNVGKWTVEISWSGDVKYNLFAGWRYDRPLIGWAKEKCWVLNYYDFDYYTDLSISETEMEVFPGYVIYYWWLVGR